MNVVEPTTRVFHIRQSQTCIPLRRAKPVPTTITPRPRSGGLGEWGPPVCRSNKEALIMYPSGALDTHKQY